MTSYLSATDLFAGCGGSSTGAVWAGVEIKIAANHWPLAVESHNANHPNTLHVCANISETNPRAFPRTDILLASPECQSHTVAKGRKRLHQGQLALFDGQAPDSSEERSRATMWDVVRFAEQHNYQVVIVENVVDIHYWPLFNDWLRAMRTLGYKAECVYFNSMFAHPTPQSRDRIYVVFWRKGNKKPNLNLTPTAWCPRCGADVPSVQSWKNPRKQWGKYGPRNQYVYCCPQCGAVVTPYYFAAANALDWALPAERIGDRQKPLKPKTLDRIRYGLAKFGQTALAVAVDYSHSDSNRARPVYDQVFPTQSGRQTVGLATPLLVRFRNNSHAHGLDEPLGVVTAGAVHHGLLMPFVVSNYGGRPGVRGVDEPLVTLSTMALHRLLIPPFLVSPNDRSVRSQAVDEPLPTQTTDRIHDLILPFIMNTAGDLAPSARAITDPLPTQVASRTPALIKMPFIASYYGSDAVAPVTDALHTVTAIDRHSLVEPVNLTPEDCYFRMLKSHEIGAAMAFPGDYVVMGNERQKVRQYGNAVTPPVMYELVRRCVESLA